MSLEGRQLNKELLVIDTASLNNNKTQELKFVDIVANSKLYYFIWELYMMTVSSHIRNCFTTLKNVQKSK